MFSEPSPSPGAAAAEEGFMGSIARAGGGATGEVLRPERTPAGYRRAVERMLRLRPRPTAVVSLNPLLGATVVTAAMHQGLRLPEHLSFATTYGDPFMRFLSPEPTRYTYQRANVRHARLIPTFVPGETLGPAPRA